MRVESHDQPAGIVLCGGKSRRLGRDKARELVGDRPLIERVTRALTQVAGEIILVLGPDQPAYPLTVPTRVVHDPRPDGGPLLGLEAGLRAAGSSYVWAVACDMPFLDPERLLDLMNWTAGFDVGVPRVGGRLQPLHGVYATSCLPIFRELLDEASLDRQPPGLHDLLDRVRTRVLDTEEGHSVEAWRRSCFSVNSREDLARAERMESG